MRTREREMNVGELHAVLADLDPAAPIRLACHAVDGLEVDYITVDSLTGGVRIMAGPGRL